MQNEQAKSTVLLNGEQAKSELTALAQKAQNLKQRLVEANEAGDGKAFEKLSKELRQTNKEMKQMTKESFDLKRVLDNLSGASMKDLARAKKELDKQLNSPAIERNSKEWKELQKQLRSVKAEMKSVNDESNVGESRLSKITSRLGLTIGVLAVAAAAWSILSNAVKEIMAFSKAVSELSALTGATGKDLDYLKGKAMELGSQYGKSATEIITAMKLVGSAKPELLENVSALADVTSAVLLLSKATGMELEPTTNAVTTIMNQFGLSALEADRTVNVLAAGSKYGAKEVDYLGDAISKVGTVAKSANLTLEQTTAAMELFGEKGVRAETAGNGFKSVLVELQSDTRNYTNGLFDLNKAIDNNNSIASDNIALTNKFGKEFFNVAQILLQNKDRFNELTTQVTGTNVAMEQMLVATDNMSGDIDKMSSSWTSFILALENGQGPIANVFRGLIQWATKALNAMSQLSKSQSQLTKDGRDNFANVRLSNFKEIIADSTDKPADITAEIISQKKIVSAEERKLQLIKDQVKAEREKWGILANSRSTVVNGEKEIKTLEGAIYSTRTYINLLGGLRTELKVPIEPLGGKDELKLNTITNLKADIAELRKELEDAEIGSEKYFKIKSNLKKKEAELDNLTDKKPKKDKETPYDKELKAKKAFFEDEEALNKKAYSDETIGEEVFHEWMYNSKLDFLNEKLKLDKKYKKDTSATEIEISDLIISENEYWNNKIKAEAEKLLREEKKNNKDSEKEVRDHLKRIEEIRSEFGLERLRLTYKQELKLLKAKLKEEKATELETATAIADFKRKKAIENTEIAAEVAGKLSQAVSNLQDMEMMAVDTKYAKQIEAAEKAGKDTTALQEKSEEEKKEIKKKYAAIDFAITTAKIISETAAAIMKASPNVPLQVAEGILGATQLGLALAQFQNVQQLYTGGFTEPGDKYKPAGIVHAGEFVANQDAVRSTPMRKVFNLIDHAQKTNTVARITSEDIARVVGVRKGFADGGYTSAAQAAGTGGGSGLSKEELAWAIQTAMQGNNAVNSALLAELQKGIKANVSASGKGGVVEATDTYNQLIKNAGR